MCEINFPECFSSIFWTSESNIDFVIWPWNSLATSLPTSIIFDLAKYKESPFTAKAKIIKIGIIKVKLLSF